MASAIATAPSLETIASRQQQFAIVPRILLADDQHEILEAVHSILSADAEFAVVGTAEDGMHAVELAMNLKPDVLVLDISMPVVNGIEAARQLKKAASHIRVVFLTVHTDPEFVEAALTAGAVGYVPKAFIAAELVPALRAALHGEIYVSRWVHWP
jgi:DNA-binding NarL/FixJ family response regulator